MHVLPVTGHSDLYSAFDAQLDETVPDYRTEQGQVVEAASQTVFADELPPYLLIFPQVRLDAFPRVCFVSLEPILTA